MAVLDGVVIFVVSWIIGTVGIYAGVQLVADRDAGTVGAAITALLGAIVYGVLGFLNVVPIVGPLLLLVLWIGVINWRYPGGWGTAAGIGFVAWIVSLAIMYGLVLVFGDTLSLGAFGVPGV